MRSSTAGAASDLLATNSLGTNLLEGGQGDDALIANRGGTNTLEGGAGNDLLVLKENASLVNLVNNDVTFKFGAQTIEGSNGRDTLRFIINDQNPHAENALIAEFQKVETAFDSSFANHQPGTFQVDGLNVTGIDQDSTPGRLGLEQPEYSLPHHPRHFILGRPWRPVGE